MRRGSPYIWADIQLEQHRWCPREMTNVSAPNRNGYMYPKESKANGIERCLGSQECLVLLQQTQVQFQETQVWLWGGSQPPVTRTSEDPIPPSGLHGNLHSHACTNMHTPTYIHMVKTKINLKNSKYCFYWQHWLVKTNNKQVGTVYPCTSSLVSETVRLPRFAH